MMGSGDKIGWRDRASCSIRLEYSLMTGIGTMMSSRDMADYSTNSLSCSLIPSTIGTWTRSMTTGPNTKVDFNITQVSS